MRTTLEGDPRVKAYLAARSELGSYAETVVPYIEAHAEEIDRVTAGDNERRLRTRVRLMQALAEPPVNIPLTAISVGFRATREELDMVKSAPPNQVGPTLDQLRAPRPNVPGEAA